MTPAHRFSEDEHDSTPREEKGGVCVESVREEECVWSGRGEGGCGEMTVKSFLEAGL